MYESFDANNEDIKNIIIYSREEERMSHIQRGILQMLMSFLIPFKEASLQLKADTYTTLPLILPTRFSLMNHLNLFGI
jgi:hypothetical protein